MGYFVIGNTDFGIDTESAIFELAPSGGGISLLTVEFEGRQGDFDRVLESQDKEWEWASYPPSFYLRDFPVPAAGISGTVTVALDREVYREYEVALYMMEHNAVEATIVITNGQRIDIAGHVDLIGKKTPFRLSWNNKSAK